MLTVLVEQHTDGDPAHVEPVQEVLYVLANHRVGTVRLLVLHQPLSHCRDDVIVTITDLDHRICETEGGRAGYNGHGELRGESKVREMKTYS